MGLLSTDHPHIFGEISPNNPSNAEKVTSGSGLTLLWKCSLEHEYEAKVFNRVKGSSCPYCSGSKPLQGVNDLKTLHPHIFKYVKNQEIIILPYSTHKIEWVCSQGHYFHQTPKAFVLQSKFTCSQCNKIPKSSIGSDPKLLKEYSSRNLQPAGEVFLKSNKKVWWQCDKGHEWEASVKNRANGRGCSQCAGRKITKLNISHPQLVNEWDEKTLSPENFTAGSSKEILWKCEKAHSYKTSIISRIDSRTNRIKQCPVCLNRIIIPSVNSFDKTHPHISNQLKNEEESFSVSYGSEQKLVWVCDEGHEYTAQVRSKTIEKSGCPLCSSSQGEKDIKAIIRSLNLEFIENDRKTITPYELDVYIPEKKIAIEFNGLYWHSEKFRGKNYHYNKWLACKKQDIQLIQIWEDDWNRNPEQIKRMIAHKLGVSEEPTVYARNTIIAEVDKDEAEVFLANNHIQGSTNGSIRIGLFQKIDNSHTKLVALMVLKKEPKTSGTTLNLLRYATSCNVTGGFTKIINNVQKTYNSKRIITFSDNTVSDGGLYQNNNFVADKELPPDYMYLIKGERKHKFGYRLKRFASDPNLKYEEGLTERELASLNNLLRIWDAGKTRWVKNF